MDLGGPALKRRFGWTALCSVVNGRDGKRRNSSIQPVKRLLALLVGGLGIRAWLHRRGRPLPAGSPVEELRAKLAESRPPEPEAEAEPESPDVDARRADVHERARRAIEELGEDEV